MAPQNGTTSGTQPPVAGVAPASRPLPPGPDDLVILAREGEDDEFGEFYWLTKDSYQDGNHDAPTSIVTQAQLLAEQGVLLADIAVDLTTGVEVICFLVNLSGIRPRPAAGPTRANPTNGRQPFQPAPLDPTDACLQEAEPATGDLIIVDRDGQQVYWVRKCEYQREACRLETADPILAEQVRLLTNQGVVLADVPGGSILGVAEMGCLVNLYGLDRTRIKAAPEEGEEEDETPTPLLPPGPDDLLILARDDEFYWLTKDSYQDGTHDAPTSMMSQASHLVGQGVVLADIPVGSIPGVGAMCYLVNLSGIRPRPAADPTRTDPTDGRQPFRPEPVDPTDACLQEAAPAADDLIIRDRNEQKFYWVKKCEYQREACKLDTIDPSLAEQIRRLANQGVVLADVPGGRGLGVDEMGCLVNLRGLLRPAIKQEEEAQGRELEEEEEEDLGEELEERPPLM